MTYLLDTNACVVHLRSGGTSRVSLRLQSAPHGDVAVPSVVREELVFGALRSRDPRRNQREVEDFLAAFASVPFDDRAADLSASMRADLERTGNRIGYNDVLIAATALTHQLTLVTHNVAEFSRLPGLSIVDWETGP